MKILGIIAEYNPFHTGHAYHIKKAKEMIHPDYTVIVMSGAFVQRGEPAIVDKWTRSKIALENGADCVIELPLACGVESADYFAHYSVLLLKEMGVTDLVFGSEDGHIETFLDIAKTIETYPDLYNGYVKDAMKTGLRYPDACNQALSLLMHKEVRTPNDLLGLAYVKEIVHHHYQITPHVIKRTNDYHETSLSQIASATALRKALKEDKDVSSYLPGYDSYQDAHFFDLNDFFMPLKYAILFQKDLSSMHLVEEGIEHLVVKAAMQATSVDELVNLCSSKRYTRVRIQRMLTHILLNNTKEEVKAAMAIDYIRLLAFNDRGRKLIKMRKGQTDFKLITSINAYDHPALAIERKAALLLSLVDATQKEKEYRSIPYHSL